MSRICIKCSGKGYHWKAYELQSHIDKTPLADIYQRGEHCIYCNGTGIEHKTNFRFIAEIIVVGVIVAAAIMFFKWMG